MPARKSSNQSNGDQIEALRDDFREDVRELHQKIDKKIEDNRKEYKDDLDKQSEKLEERSNVKFKEVGEKIEKVHDCVHQARESINELQKENAVAHAEVAGDLKAMNEKIDKADASRKIIHEKLDELRTEKNSAPSSKKSESPILDAIRKRAITILSIVATTALTAFLLIALSNCTGQDYSGIAGLK